MAKKPPRDQRRTGRPEPLPVGWKPGLTRHCVPKGAYGQLSAGACPEHRRAGRFRASSAQADDRPKALQAWFPTAGLVPTVVRPAQGAQIGWRVFANRPAATEYAVSSRAPQGLGTCAKLTPPTASRCSGPAASRRPAPTRPRPPSVLRHARGWTAGATAPSRRDFESPGQSILQTGGRNRRSNLNPASWGADTLGDHLVGGRCPTRAASSQ